MFRATLSSLRIHRRRFVATVLAVVLGVGFLTGTTMLNDTIDATVTNLWRVASASTDVVVRGPAIYTTNAGRTQYASLPDSALERVRAVPGVASAEARKNANHVQLLAPDGSGRAEGRGGGYVRSWPGDERFSLNRIVEGRAPAALGELVIDHGLAADSGYGLGDAAFVSTPGGRVELRIVGLSERARDDGSRGWTTMGATVEQVQRLADQVGQVDAVDVIAADGVSPAELAERIDAAAVAPSADVATSAEVEAENEARFRQQMLLFTRLLVLFAGVALLVTAFIIANTFGILVAQRSRELALFRAIGATRRQVLASVLTEAAAVGVVASLIGVAVGVVLARGGLAGLDALGLRLPTSGFVARAVRARDAFGIGLAVTLAAATPPAIRATRVPPIAALRAAAIDTSGASRLRVAGGALLLAGAAVAVWPAFGGGVSDLDTLPRIGGGVAAAIGGVLVLGPVLVRPVVAAVAWPLPRLRGTTGRLARQNARRSPRRTASSIAALTVGVALVAFITVLAASVRTSIHQSFAGGFGGDLLVRPDRGGGSFGADPALRTELAALPEVEAITALTGAAAGDLRPDGNGVAVQVAGIDPAGYLRLFDLDVTDGSLDDLGDDGLILDRTVAADRGVGVGDEVTLVSQRAERVPFRVAALVDEQALLPDWATSHAGIRRLTDSSGELLLALATTGADDEARAAVERVVERHPTMVVQSPSEYTADESDDITSVLNLLYVLLAMSIVIALIGITNTLSLSVHEHTREIGLLRAVGAGRAQVRAIIRWEAVLIGVVGALVGLAVGVGAGWIIVRSLGGVGLIAFTAPLRPMAAIVVTGAVIGVIAAIRPARTASRVDIVSAIADEG